MILLDGKSAAEEIKVELKQEITELGYVPRLAIVMVGKNSVSERFVLLKEKYAKDIGAETRRYEFDELVTTNELRARMNDIVHEPQNRGIIVQLPLPVHIDVQSILNTVVPEKDVDVLSARAVGDFQVGKPRRIVGAPTSVSENKNSASEAKVMPPVVGAVKALFDKHSIEVKNKKVVVLGYGRLVGQPLSIWLLASGAQVTIISDEKQFDASIIKNADIVISGTGKPQFIKGEHIKEGATVVDVGTSEMNGEVVGDVDFDSVSRVASFLTPVKGGVGPLTVAMVFKNLLTLAKLKK
ncbi:MAG: bifunctional 5,10-methylenetetrahydrofolate dehydrogenase/5,10-methenyltetrahydrofolate cyclohydrolase [Patescibacteria group bacterium]